MDLEIVILSEVSQSEREISYLLWNLKKDTNEVIYRTETASQTENKFMILERKCGLGGDK